MSAVLLRGFLVGAMTVAACMAAGAAPFLLTASADGSPPGMAATAYQSNPAHDGRAASEGVTLPIEKIWSAPADGPSYPLIAENRVIVTERVAGTDEKRITAFDARSGEEVWSHPLSGSYSWTNATYDRGQVFVVNFDGLVRAFTAADGAQLWTVQMPGQYWFLGPPTAAGGVMYVLGGGSAGTLYAVDESDGTVLWTADAGGDSSSPAVAGDTIVVSAGCATRSFDLAGHERWVFREECRGVSDLTPAIRGDDVYSRVNGGIVFANSDGSHNGSFASEHIPAFADDLMYTVDGGRIDALQVDNGVPRWHVDPRDELVTAPLVMGEWVVAGGAGGTIYAFDRNTGATVWSDRIPSTIPGPGEGDASQPVTGLGAAGPLLVVPATDRLVGYRAKGIWNLASAPASPATPVPTFSPTVAPESPAPVTPVASSPPIGTPGGPAAAPPTRGSGFHWNGLLLAILVGAIGGGIIGATRMASRRAVATSPPMKTGGLDQSPPARPDIDIR